MSQITWEELLEKIRVYVKDFLFRAKDKLLLGGWLGGLFLLGGLAWFVTQPARVQALENSVNRILARRERPLQLADPVPRRELGGRKNFRGVWYNLAEEDGSSPVQGRILVFSAMLNGIFVPCAALVSPAGQVEEVFPLTGVAGKTPDPLPLNLVKIYVRRIEGGMDP